MTGKVRAQRLLQQASKCKLTETDVAALLPTLLALIFTFVFSDFETRLNLML